MRLWLIAGSWAAYAETDGKVPESRLLRLPPAAACNTVRLAQELESTGLWTSTDDVHQFPNWRESDRVCAPKATKALQPQEFINFCRFEWLNRNCIFMLGV